MERALAVSDFELARKTFVYMQQDMTPGGGAGMAALPEADVQN